MFVRRRSATRPVSPRDSRVLDTLLHRVANADQPALAELYRMVSTDIRVQVEQTLSDPGDVDAVMAATFVEVWWLARGHAASHPDVRAWIRSIATRRACERHRANAAAGIAADVVALFGTLSGATVSRVQDETTTMLYASLINGWLVDGAGNRVRMVRRPLRSGPAGWATNLWNRAAP